MFTSKTKVLLVLPTDLVDRARVLAGTATTALKLSVSLQIVLRGLIEEGLKRTDARALMDNFERQARAVRDIRRTARVGARMVPEATETTRRPTRHPEGARSRH